MFVALLYAGVAMAWWSHSHSHCTTEQADACLNRRRGCSTRREHSGESPHADSKVPKASAAVFFKAADLCMLASCNTLAIAHLYAQPPQQAGCKPGWSLGHNELGRMCEHTLRAGHFLVSKKWGLGGRRRDEGAQRREREGEHAVGAQQRQ